MANFTSSDDAAAQLRGMLDDHDTDGIPFPEIARRAIKHDPRKSLSNNWRLADYDELARILRRLRDQQ